MSIETLIPILNLKTFQFVPEEDNSFLYFELAGERQIEKPHKHDFFLFLLIEKGSGTHSIDFVDYSVAAHQIHVLLPEQVHKWTFGADTLAYQLMMSKTIFETLAVPLRFSLRYHFQPVIQLSAQQFEEFFYEFRKIECELLQKPTTWEIVNARTAIISQLTHKAAEQLYKDQFTLHHQQPLLAKFLLLIDEHFKTAKSVVFYANQLHITPNYLNILCKKHFKATASHFIYDRVILEAKRLIQVSGFSFKELAYELGFSDPSYFSNFFKNQTGISPGQFKEML